MLERNVKGDTEETRRDDADALFTINDRDRFADGQEFTACCVSGQAGLFQDRNERCGTAVHDRYFRSINVDVQVVYAICGKRRQQMLNG